jgi:hypothetical protein
VPAVLLAGLSMIGVGYLVASAVLVLKEPSFFVDATNFLFAIASGVAFPITVLPIFVRPLAYLLPTTYALDLLRVHALGTRPLMDRRSSGSLWSGSASPRSGSVDGYSSGQSTGSAYEELWASIDPWRMGAPVPGLLPSRGGDAMARAVL